jgi:alpha-L-fucosidase
MSNEKYRKYFELFNPDLYDPWEWARAARDAGMKYVVITSKHHDGFCLWDSDQTDYDAAGTPYGKDLLKPFVKAFRGEGLRVGFYYSGPDWHHPEYPIDIPRCPHPMRNNEEMLKKNKERDINKYLDYQYNQVKELLTEYGQIDLFWSDYGSTLFGEGNRQKADRLVGLIRSTQPQIIINDRLYGEYELPGWGWGWDYRSPEQSIPAGWVTMNGRKVPWETCQTIDGSWGYNRDKMVTSRHGWKSSEQLLRLLVETVSKGGNLLLNVGPTARGTIDEPMLERLAAIGEWMDKHSRSIYNCTAAPEEFPKPDNCLLTYNPDLNRIYVHILEWPMGKFHLPGFAGKVRYAQLLNDASEIRIRGGGGHWDWVWSEENTLTLNLPMEKPDVQIPVIELFLK